MADMGYGCVFGDCTAAVNHMITTLNPASTISTCDEHYPASLIPLLGAELGVDPGEFYVYVEKYVKRETVKAEKALADAQAAEAAKGSQGTAEQFAAANPAAGLGDDQDLDAQPSEGGVMDTAP